MFKSLAKPIFVAAGCVLGFSAAAVAMPSNTVTINTTCAAAGSGNVNIIPQTGAIGQSQGTLATGLNGCAFGAQTRAGGGSVGILATLTKTGSVGFAPDGRLSASTTVVIDLGVPDNFEGGLILVSVSPHLDGEAFASVEQGGSSVRSAGSSLRADVSISGADASNAPVSNNAARAAQVGVSGNSASPAVSESLPDNLSSAIFIDPTKSIVVTFTLSASFGVNSFDASSVVSGVRAFNSLSFALSGPALGLPDGFTANATGIDEFGNITGIIVDNVFVGQGTNANGTQVPEPGALALFGIGLVGLGVARRRRRR